MKNINVVVLTGNLTRDPELRSLPSGTSVCEMGVAVNESFKNGSTGEWEERANFFDVTVWGAQGENCAKYLSKGRGVAIHGRLRWESWEKDGQKRSKVKVIADQVQFLNDGKGEGSSSGGRQYAESDLGSDFSMDEPREPPPPPPVPAASSREDEIPF